VRNRVLSLIFRLFLSTFVNEEYFATFPNLGIQSIALMQLEKGSKTVIGAAIYSKFTIKFSNLLKKHLTICFNLAGSSEEKFLFKTITLFNLNEKFSCESSTRLNLNRIFLRQYCTLLM